MNELLRCACCDETFRSIEECRRHFESYWHEVVAIPAWIRYISKLQDKTMKPAEENGFSKCPFCEDGMAICPHCQGLELELLPCYECNSTGKVMCNECDGSGYIQRKKQPPKNGGAK